MQHDHEQELNEVDHLASRYGMHNIHIFNRMKIGTMLMETEQMQLALALSLSQEEGGNGGNVKQTTTRMED